MTDGASDGGDGAAAPTERAPEDSLGLWWMRFLAREDTTGIPKQYLYGKWVRSRAQLPTLKEIIGWCIEAEKNRSSLIDDLSFTRRTRTAVFWGDPGDDSAKRELIEDVNKVYLKPPDRMRTVTLGQRTWKSEEKKETVETKVKVFDSSDHLTDLPFFFEVLDDYTFKIVDRRIVGDRVLYKISFDPRGDFATLPEGWFLVDTRSYQILHAEMSWTENVPYPLFLKSVPRVILTRRQYGDVWLADRTFVKVVLRDIPFVSSPKVVEVDIQREDVALNAGLPDSVFAN